MKINVAGSVYDLFIVSISYTFNCYIFTIDATNINDLKPKIIKILCKIFNNLINLKKNKEFYQ